MEHKSAFHNDSFKTNFEARAQSDVDTASEKITILKEMTQDVILDYKFNKNPSQTYKLLRDLELYIANFFDKYSNHRFNEYELEELTDLCRKVNEDPALLEVREKGSNERIPTEEYTAITKNSKVHVASTNNYQYGYNQPGEPHNDEVSKQAKGDNFQAISPSPDNSPVATLKKEQETRPLEAVGTYESNRRVEENRNNIQLEQIAPVIQENIQFAQPHQQVINIQKIEEETTRGNIERKKQEFLNLIQQTIHEFEEHRIEFSGESRTAVLQYAENNKEVELQEFFREQLELHKKMLGEVAYWEKTLKRVVQEYDNNEGYIEDKARKNYRLRYKVTPENKAMLKIDSQLDTPFFNILALMYEADGLNHWVPFCSDAKLVKPLHRAAHAYWIKYGMPPPMSNRECYCYGFGFDRLDKNGSVVLVSEKIHDDKEFLDHYGIQLAKTKNVKMDIDVTIELVPISRNSTKIRVITIVDPRVKNAPISIIAWISKKAAQHLIEKLLKKAKNIKGTLWEKRIKEKREFYGWLEGRVNEFLDRHNLE